MSLRKSMSLFKYLLTVLGYIVFSFVDLFIKTDKKILIFTSGSCNSYSGNSKYIYDAMQNDERYQCYWLTKNPQVYEYLKSQGRNVLYLYSFKSLCLIRKTKYFIGTNNNGAPNILLSHKKVIIQTWHGSPLKTMGTLKKQYRLTDWTSDFFMSKCNYFISPSCYVSKLFEDCYKISKERFVITGNPRNDIIFKELNKEDVLEKIGKKKGLNFDKVILYCPTFRETGNNAFFPFEDFDIGKLNEFLKANRILCILRNHYYENDSILKLFKNASQFLFAPAGDCKIDIQELMNISDILITDYSSIYFDYLLLNRPIIFTPVDLEEYEKTRGFLFDYNDNTPGSKVLSFSGFLQQMKLSINQPNLYEMDRSRVNEKFNKYKDNRSTERVLDLINKLMGNE